MICKRCGTVFCVDNETDAFYLSPDSVLYCSKLCRRKSRPSHLKQKRERRKTPRKVRNQLAALRERDGDDCWLCLLPIDFEIADINDPMRYSRDHFVPRGRGGDGSLANMRLAHRGCNSKRGRRLRPAAVPALAGSDVS